MQLYEYQIKHLMDQFGFSVLKGKVAYTPKESVQVASSLDLNACVIKAQVHDTFDCLDQNNTFSPIIEVCDRADIESIAERMLGNTLVIKDVSYEVKKIYIEEKISFKDTYGVSLRLDYLFQKLILSIKHGNKLSDFEIPLNGIGRFISHRIAHHVGVPKKLVSKFANILELVFKFFKHYSLLGMEINPLCVSDDDKFYVADAQVIFDPDALYLYPEITRLYEVDERLERRAQALKNNFRYIQMAGNIACIVNGTGLAKATLDLIYEKGGEVSSLLDIGPDPSKEVIEKAFKMVLSEPQVEGILINIFGGVTRCDIISEGILSASNEIALRLPLVARMDGTNAQIGERILVNSRLPFIITHSISEAVDTIVNSVKERD